MPLLQLEPFVYPDDLLERPIHDSETQGRWWVIHTRPRTEKALARHCVGKGLAFYLPLYHRRWRSGGRLLNSYLPLFSGYLFLHGDEHIRLSAFESNLVARAIPVADQHQLHTDLVRVHRLIQAGSGLAPEDRLEPGAPVVITAGPLAGLEGKVIRRDKSHRFFVEVRFLQQGVSVEIDSSMIQPR